MPARSRRQIEPARVQVESEHRAVLADRQKRDGTNSESVYNARDLRAARPGRCGGDVNGQGGRQRYGVPSRRATRARRSASEPTAVMSMPLSINASISARMISARFRLFPLRARVARRSRWRICRSKSTTETFDHVSLWTGGRPGPGFARREDIGRACTGRARFFAMREQPVGRQYTAYLLVAQTQQ